MRIIVITVALTLLSLPALGAAPLQVPLQGVIRDNTGTPVYEGAYSVLFPLYDAPDATGGHACFCPKNQLQSRLA